MKFNQLGKTLRAAQRIREMLESNPSISVDTIARQLNNERLGLNRGTVANLRRDYLKYRAEGKRHEFMDEPPVILNVPVIPAIQLAVEVTRKHCGRCGSEGHWPAECFEFVAPDALTEPDPLSVVDQTALAAALPATTEPEPASPEQEHASMPQPQTNGTPNTIAPTPLIDPRGRKLTPEGMLIRRRRVEELLDANPSMEPVEVQARLRDEFGVGTDNNFVYSTCRLYREVHGLAAIPHKHQTTGRPYYERPGARRQPERHETHEEDTTADEELDFIAGELERIVRAHGLGALTLTYDGGRIEWTAEVKRTLSGRRILRAADKEEEER